MDKHKDKTIRRVRRRAAIRNRLEGTPSRPRLAVYKSLNHIYAQIIDDLAGKTLAAAGSRDSGLKLDKTGNSAAAKSVGKLLAEKAKAAGVKEVAFDRGGFRFHGRIKALAEGAREGGLKF